MNRREMLHRSLEDLLKVLPAMLGMLGGLYGSVADTEKGTPHGQAACFPKRHKKLEAHDGQRTNRKEE